MQCAVCSFLTNQRYDSQCYHLLKRQNKNVNINRSDFKNGLISLIDGIVKKYNIIISIIW